MVFGSILLMSLTNVYTFATNSLYDRSSIEELMRQLIGKRNITEIITDELIVVTYEYNSQKPRLFSKYFA